MGRFIPAPEHQVLTNFGFWIEEKDMDLQKNADVPILDFSPAKRGIGLEERRVNRKIWIPDQSRGRVLDWKKKTGNHR
jgi:hypothetical protein